jgi:mRNA interferase RelE/StbE
VTAPYRLQIKRSAERELRGTPKPDMARIVRRIEKLAEDPRPPGCEKLFDTECHRIRQGDYRILYTVDDKQRFVEIYKIGHRREVYK